MMTEMYYVIVGFLLLLAVFDLFVGVSNDAVNFLNSAVGAKVARYRTVMIVASAGVLLGALMSSGMMDVARHGILQPSHYSFAEVMTVFLAVMVTDVVILDTFNTLGMPTSTTVSMVFELLGASFVMSCIKMSHDGSLSLNMLLNSDKALSVIIAIFVSVAIAFVAGVLVQWLLRLGFTFKYKERLRYGIALYGGLCFTALGYFILVKSLAGSPFMPTVVSAWVAANTQELLLGLFVCSAILSQVLHAFGVGVLRLIVLAGTFALAMAFAGNDLVNFIGVPLAALDAMTDFVRNGGGDAQSFMMVSLMESARSPFVFLALAGIIMCVAMVTSKKARKVVKTSTSLSRQDEGEEMFGSSRVARSIVRFSQSVGDVFGQYVPRSALGWLDSRFNKEDADLRDGAAFDEIRASVNLVLAAMLIIMGTTLKLPLSTTYVTFMVAMGASLADRAWSRESAVFRITGVISVIGGWFITAGVAFAAASIVCSIMYYGSAVAMFLFMGLAVFVLWRSHTNYEEQVEAPEVTSARVMLRAKDSGEVWNLLRAHFVESQSMVLNLMLADYRQLVEAMEQGDLKTLRRVQRNLKAAAVSYKRNRRLELIALRRSPMEVAIERGTWFHLAQNSDQQFIYCLTRVLDPVLEHVDNGFEPIPKTYMTEYAQVLQRVEVLIQSSQTMIQTGDYGDYKNIREVADHLKDELSTLRKTHIRRIQSVQTISLTTSTLYLNLLQETQELLSIMRHQLRSTRNFTM